MKPFIEEMRDERKLNELLDRIFDDSHDLDLLAAEVSNLHAPLEDPYEIAYNAINNDVHGYDITGFINETCLYDHDGNHIYRPEIRTNGQWTDGGRKLFETILDNYRVIATHATISTSYLTIYDGDPDGAVASFNEFVSWLYGDSSAYLIDSDSDFYALCKHIDAIDLSITIEVTQELKSRPTVHYFYGTLPY